MVNFFRKYAKVWLALGALLLITVLLIIFLSPKPHTNIVYKPDASDIPGYSTSDYEGTVTMIFYRDVMYGIDRKAITGEIAQQLTDMLLSATEAGEIAPKIADGELSAIPIDAVPLRTVWLEVGGNLYRINEDRTQLCRVESHYSEGKILTPAVEFFELIDPVCAYWPTNRYRGIYHNGTLTLTHVYKVEPTVDVTVTDLEIGETDKDYQHYTITLKLRSKTDQLFQTCIESGGGDLFYTLESDLMELKPGWSKTLSMEFQCPKDASVCGVAICVGNTVIDLRVEQNK